VKDFWAGFEKQAKGQGIFTTLFSDEDQRHKGKKAEPKDESPDYALKQWPAHDSGYEAMVHN